MKTPFFLTEVAQDWTEPNLASLQLALREAEDATLVRTNALEDPLFDTPNLANVRGVVRWSMVAKHLHVAANNGRFHGITANWVDLGGTHMLELRGKHTSVTACHLLRSDDNPRPSEYRKNCRIQNQVCPWLQGFQQPTPESEPLNLVLAHGGKNGEFAYLRAYTDPDPTVYRLLSKNIMQMPVLLPSIDFETVGEPEVQLNPAATEKESLQKAS